MVTRESVDLGSVIAAKCVTPVIISKSISDWPALHKWTPAFFRDAFGERTITIQISESGDLRYKATGELESNASEVKGVTVRSLIEHMTTDRYGVKYYGSQLDVTEDFPELLADTGFPAVPTDAITFANRICTSTIPVSLVSLRRSAARSYSSRAAKQRA